MTRDKFEEFLANAKIEKNKWLQLEEIEGIVLNDGRGIYPNWRHLRFYIKDSVIFIQHGESYPYGARLSTVNIYTYDRMDVSFPPGKVILPSIYYKEFRDPKTGDILVSSDGLRNVLSESLILNVEKYMNTTKLYVATPIKTTETSKLSFYDPKEFDKSLCSHGTVAEGIYMKFKNNIGRLRGGLLYHEIIKVKDIQEIILSLKGNKTYKVF